MTSQRMSSRKFQAKLNHVWMRIFVRHCYTNGHEGAGRGGTWRDGHLHKTLQSPRCASKAPFLPLNAHHEVGRKVVCCTSVGRNVAHLAQKCCSSLKSGHIRLEKGCLLYFAPPVRCPARELIVSTETAEACSKYFGKIFDFQWVSSHCGMYHSSLQVGC